MCIFAVVVFCSPSLLLFSSTQIGRTAVGHCVRLSFSVFYFFYAHCLWFLAFVCYVSKHRHTSTNTRTHNINYGQICFWFFLFCVPFAAVDVTFSNFRFFHLAPKNSKRSALQIGIQHPNRPFAVAAADFTRSHTSLSSLSPLPPPLLLCPTALN